MIKWLRAQRASEPRNGETAGANAADKTTISGRRWQDYCDLLPGFAALETDAASVVFAATRGIDYKPAEREEMVKYDGRLHPDIKRILGVGFIQLDGADDLSSVLFSKELRRAFVYAATSQSGDKAEEMARMLMNAAGWSEGGETGPRIEHRELSAADEGLPYYALGAEIEDEHARVVAAREMAAGDMDMDYFFVRELKNYYLACVERHRHNLRRYVREEKLDYAGWEEDSGQCCLPLWLNMDTLLKKGTYKIYFTKAKDSAYEEAVRILRTLPEMAGEPCIVHERQHRHPEGPPDNIELALAYSVARIREHLATCMAFENARDSGNTTTANPHLDRLTESRSARNDLKHLIARRTRWVAFDETAPETALYANLRSIKARLDGLEIYDRLTRDEIREAIEQGKNTGEVSPVILLPGALYEPEAVPTDIPLVQNIQESEALFETIESDFWLNWLEPPEPVRPETSGSSRHGEPGLLAQVPHYLT